MSFSGRMIRSLIRSFGSVGLALLPLWFPLLVSWFHTWNILSVNQCTLAEGWKDHVNLICHQNWGMRPHGVGSGAWEQHGSSSSIRIEPVVAPTLVKWSETLVLLSSPLSPPSSSNQQRIIVGSDGTKHGDSSSTARPRFTVTLVSQTTTIDKSTITTTTGYGFRRNNNRQTTLMSRLRQYPIPIATVLLLVINVGFFFGLWYYQVDPSRVALNSNFNYYVRNSNNRHDLGTSMTGHLSHFELWHLGFNMMTWVSVGPILEKTHCSSISLLLWTVSLLPIASLVVWAINALVTMFRQRRYGDGTSMTSSSSITSTSPSSMVGFSGILFAWVVVSTLGNGPGSSSCPIFFLPTLCFKTFVLVPATINTSGIYMNIGPLIQLVVLQVLLPRVSWKGHLAGIVVGFAWHSRILPPLGLMQPSVLFPVLWMAGHAMISRKSTTTSNTTTTSTTTISGVRNDDDDRRRRPDPGGSDLPLMVRSATGRLVLVRNLLLLHLLFGHAGVLGLGNSSALSSLLIVMVLQLVIHHGHNGQFAVFGVTARAFVGLSYILIVIDGLTVGNWIPTWSLWNNTGAAVATILSRDLILLLSIGSIIMGTLERLATWEAGTVHPGESEKGLGTWWIIVYPIARYTMVLDQSIQNVQMCNRIRLLTVPVTRRMVRGWNPRREEGVVIMTPLVVGFDPHGDDGTTHHEGKNEETTALV